MRWTNGAVMVEVTAGKWWYWLRPSFWRQAQRLVMTMSPGMMYGEPGIFAQAERGPEVEDR